MAGSNEGRQAGACWVPSVLLLQLYLAAVALLAAPAMAQQSGFNIQSAGVRILFPPGYRSQVIDFALADFGKPLYGGALTGQLVYPSEDARLAPDGQAHRCPEQPCEFGCGPLKSAQPPFKFDKKSGQLIIMLVDRGPRSFSSPCYFLTKAWNAQQAGADALLVVDDTDGDLTTAIPPEEEAVAGLLKQLTISAALIARKDGDLLKGLLKDQAKVTLSLNWTNLEPRRSVVAWELWTTTNDQCGTLCDQQIEFVKAMKPWATALDQSNLTTFTPHYITWSCPAEYVSSPECRNECIMNGAYCAPDPDGSLTDGYRGQDVLAMNVRNLCFARLAAAAGSPWLWWDYQMRFSANCSSKTQQYTAACATQVFDAMNGALLLNNTGRGVWDACVAAGSPPAPGDRWYGNVTLDLFEKELDLQAGTGDVSPVSILPTVRINGQQYRGTLDVSSVMRAICAAFPLGSEPSVCNEQWVSDNECDTNGPGYKLCRVGDPTASGRNRCVNTFDGYRCECGQGWVRGAKADTGEQVCEDLNECLATSVRYTDPDCSCPRCACLNTPGSYKCTGPLPDKCTATDNFGGCWREVVDGQVVHACTDTVADYQRLAARGTPVDNWFMCKCPPCYTAVGGNDANPTCKALCPASNCVAGVCSSSPAPAGGGGGGGGDSSGSGGGSGSGGMSGGGSGSGGMSGGGGSGSGSGGSAPAAAKDSGGGVSVGGVLAMVLVSVAATFAGMYAVYHYVLRQRMQGEIREIMSQYMPLNAQGGNRRGARNGGGSYAALSPVDEAAEAEAAPLMRPPGAAGAAVPGGGAIRPTFGALTASSGGGFTAASASSYQPPKPLGDEEDEEAGGAKHQPPLGGDPSAGPL